jgi:cytosine/adenosine deaminase-related metal-dependent hydrolase
MKTSLTAAWIAPINGPVIRDGSVVFSNGNIAAIGPTAALGDQIADSRAVDLGNSVILPGLVNAHTHLELSTIQRGARPARFVDWIIELMGKPVPPGGIEAGIAQCLRFGVTAVGDITTNPAVTRPLLIDSPLSGVSYGEVRAMAQRRGLLEPRIQQSLNHLKSQISNANAARPHAVRAGISPHAPYSIESTGIARCLQAAREYQLPLTMHLAETPDEVTFLADHSGPFRELWNLLNAWDDQVPTFVGGPIRFASALGLLDYPALLAHVNYCDDDELTMLAQGHASVVYCPRTHAYFGHPPHRWRDMLAAGINVAVGTDSCASSPDLNLVDDLRLLHEIAPEVDPTVLWEMASTRAASAIQCAGIGSLAIGNAADVVVFPVTGDDPLREILENRVLPTSVWIGATEYATAGL